MKYRPPPAVAWERRRLVALQVASSQLVYAIVARTGEGAKAGALGAAGEPSKHGARTELCPDSGQGLVCATPSSTPPELSGRNNASVDNLVEDTCFCIFHSW